jgi:hypothetical protein
VFEALATLAAVAAIITLLGSDDCPRPFKSGDPLVTMPTPGTRTVPAAGWHIDFPARSALRLKWLAYLAPVRAGGGHGRRAPGSRQHVAHRLRDHPGDPADPPRSATRCCARWRRSSN